MTTNKAREKILEFMCKLGQRYLKDGNDDEAFRWLKAAADLGNHDACLSLFKMYRNGKITRKAVLTRRLMNVPF